MRGLRGGRAVVGVGLAVAALSGAAAPGDDWRSGRDVPPGWVGLLTGGGMIIGESAGVHLGNGRIVTSAHALPAYEVGWRVDVYQPQGMGNPVQKQRAVLKVLDVKGDIAVLELAPAAEFTAAQACAQPPKADEAVLFFRVTRDKLTMTAILSVQASFAGERSSTIHPGGAAKPPVELVGYGFSGALQTGMAGGAAYSAERGCVFGIASAPDVAPVDTAANGSDAAVLQGGTFVIPVARLLP